MLHLQPTVCQPLRTLTSTHHNQSFGVCAAHRHAGNVFCVRQLPRLPHLLATTAADGLLRISNLHTGASYTFTGHQVRISGTPKPSGSFLLNPHPERQPTSSEPRFPTAPGSSPFPLRDAPRVPCTFWRTLLFGVCPAPSPGQDCILHSIYCRASLGHAANQHGWLVKTIYICVCRRASCTRPLRHLPPPQCCTLPAGTAPAACTTYGAPTDTANCWWRYRRGTFALLYCCTAVQHHSVAQSVGPSVAQALSAWHPPPQPAESHLSWFAACKVFVPHSHKRSSLLWFIALQPRCRRQAVASCAPEGSARG